MNPVDPDVHFSLALAQSQVGNHEAAIDSYKAALELGHRSPYLCYNNYPTTTLYAGRRVPCIRVKIPAAAVPAGVGELPADEIPFLSVKKIEWPRPVSRQTGGAFQPQTERIFDARESITD